jgi:hypothetical protein
VSANHEDSNAAVERLLDERLSAVGQAVDADVLAYLGPMEFGIDDEIKYAIEDMDQRGAKLLVVLETPGGFVEVAERIANIFRYHYGRVEFLVPSYAMSAGTVLVMSGDAIHMDYASVLGPIDPQVQRPDTGRFIPALGYLEQYRRLVEKSRQGELTTAELTYMIQNFDPAELYLYEQERELSIALLKDWLVKYKFKDWTHTRSRGKKVTQQMRTRRAGQIARELSNTSRWHSHGRGIPMEILRRDLRLEIDDFGADQELGPAVRVYFRLLKDYTARRGHGAVVLHRSGFYFGL